MDLKIIEITGVVLLGLELMLLAALWKRKKLLKQATKRLALFGLILVPILTMFTANYHVFETSKTVEACMNCHVMKPMGTDMLNPHSQTLAARHMTNGWIKENQCYGCHKDYGLNGTMKAKTDGYRHLMRYITGTFKEPITYRGEFDFNNCLSCHQGTPTFERLKEHQPVVMNLAKEESTISCANCHGRVHPTRMQRTPGHPDYDQLMSDGIEFERAKTQELESIKSWLSKID